jgi:hypothetical protein
MREKLALVLAVWTTVIATPPVFVEEFVHKMLLLCIYNPPTIN